MSSDEAGKDTLVSPVTGWKELNIKLGPVWITGKDSFHEEFIEGLRRLPEDKRPIVGGYNPAEDVITIEKEGVTPDLGYPPGVQKWELAVMEGLEPVGYKLRIENDGEDPSGWTWEQVEATLRPIAAYFGDYVGITDNFQVELIGYPYRVSLIELTDSTWGPNETGHFRIIGDAVDPRADDFDRRTRQYFFKDKTLLSYWGNHWGEIDYGYGSISPVWVSDGRGDYGFHLANGYNLEVWAPIIARQLLQLGVDDNTQIKIDGLSGGKVVLYKGSLRSTAERFDRDRIGIEGVGDTLEVGEVTFVSRAIYDLKDGRKMGIVSIDPLARRVKFRYDTNDVGTINGCSFEEFAKLGIEVDGSPVGFWKQRGERTHWGNLYYQFEDQALSEAIGGESVRLVGVVDSEAGVVWADEEGVSHEELMGGRSMFETDARVRFQYFAKDNTWLISGNSDEILEFLIQLPKMAPVIREMDCRFMLRPTDATDSRLAYDGGMAMGRKWLQTRMRQLWNVAEIDFSGREYLMGKRYGLRPRREDETMETYREMTERVKGLRIERGRLLPRQEYGESLDEYWQRLNAGK